MIIIISSRLLFDVWCDNSWQWLFCNFT